MGIPPTNGPPSDCPALARSPALALQPVTSPTTPTPRPGRTPQIVLRIRPARLQSQSGGVPGCQSRSGRRRRQLAQLLSRWRHRQRTRPPLRRLLPTAAVRAAVNANAGEPSAGANRPHERPARRVIALARYGPVRCDTARHGSGAPSAGWLPAGRDDDLALACEPCRSAKPHRYGG